MPSPPKPSKKAERFHFGRAVFHVCLGAFAYSVWSLVEGAIASGQGARAERRSLENPPPS